MIWLCRKFALMYFPKSLNNIRENIMLVVNCNLCAFAVFDTFNKNTLIIFSRQSI